jgi:ABC-type transport system involved in multi-copper enzyme maturation permease subunit
MTLRRLGAVAWHAFKENVRDRVLVVIVAFALILVVCSVLIAQLSAGEDVKIVKDFGLAIIEAGGVLISVFLGVGLISKEIERRSLLVILAKPLHRWEFIVGKYAGLMLTIAVNAGAMTAVLYAVLGYLDWRALPAARAAWEAPAVDPRLALAVAMIGGELALVAAVALFFSSFSSSALLSALLTAGLLTAGLLSADLRSFGSLVEVSPMAARIVETAGWVIPSFSAFDIKAQVVHGLPVDPGFVAATMTYAALYVVALLAGTVTIFSRREFA